MSSAAGWHIWAKLGPGVKGEVLYSDPIDADGVPQPPSPRPGGCVVGHNPSGKFVFFFPQKKSLFFIFLFSFSFL
jgi:hypothetical protein